MKPLWPFHAGGPPKVRSDPAGRCRKSVGTGVGTTEQTPRARSQQTDQHRYYQRHDCDEECILNGRGPLIGTGPVWPRVGRALKNKECAREHVDHCRSLFPLCSTMSVLKHLASQGVQFGRTCSGAVPKGP
jgi:hypothetical protein